MSIPMSDEKLNDLKLQHYRERLASTEETVATLRAKNTILENELAATTIELESLRSATEEPEPEEEKKPQMPRRPR